MENGRVSRGEKIAAGSGALLFAFGFLNWFAVSGGGINASYTAWDSLEWIRWAVVLSVAVAIGLPALKATGSTIRMPVPVGVAIALAGGLAFGLIAVRLISPPGLDLPAEAEVTRSAGMYLGLIAAAGVTYGGYGAMAGEGATFKGTADGLSSRKSGRDAAGERGRRDRRVEADLHSRP